MLGKVTATRLNVRGRPQLDAKVLGRLASEAIVEILGETQRWLEIDYQGARAFVHGDYVQPLHAVSTLKARVTATRLNVRRAPSLAAPVASVLPRNTLVNVLGTHPGWLEIEVNHDTGFVSRDYVEIIEGGTPRQGTVTAGILNVRAAPDGESAVLGQLAGGSRVHLLARIGNWHETRFNGVPGYVHASYIAVADGADGDRAPGPDSDAGEPDAELLDVVPLAPETRYPVAGARESQSVARTWNKFGGLLQALADHHAIDIGCAVAVLCVESAGKGFEQDNDNRMIIRLENHKFWHYWGKRQPETFARHFKYNSTKSWLGHQWRSVATDPWESFHGNQVMEWRVLEFARRLDDTAALCSISMGAPQIMGFHYARLGFASVQRMFERFGADIRYQILGFFDFLNATPGMLQALRDLDFVKFAGLYNGSGQKEKYGAWIKAHYEALARIDTARALRTALPKNTGTRAEPRRRARAKSR